MDIPFMRELEDFLKSYYDEANFDRICSVENELNDAVREFDKNYSMNPLYKHRGWEDKEGYILNALGHISANPSDPERKRILANSYVYYSESKCQENDNKLYPNYSKEDAEVFVDQLIRVSKQEHSRSLDGGKFPTEIFFLSGERGIGKTIFINHLFSTYNDFLNNKKVIWIRLDLSENFGGTKPDLHEWLNAKSVYVILKYYFSKSQFPELYHLITQTREIIAATVTEPNLSYYNKNIDKIESMYFRNIDPVILDKDVVEPIIASTFVNLVIKAGYSFIYTIDNMDKLENTNHYRTKSLHLYSELEKLISPKNKLGGCILMVTRPETLDFFQNRAGSSLKKHNNTICLINFVGFLDIINSRLEYLQKYGKTYLEVRGWDSSDWEDHMTDFKSFIYKEITLNKSFEEFILGIEKIYFHNNRIKSQLLQLFYHHFLDYKKYNKRYKLLEAMCKAGYHYPPQIYYYIVSENDLVLQSNNKVFDNIFLPTLFDFPYHKDYKFNKLPIAKSYLLISIRILQVIRAYFSYVKSPQSYIPAQTLFDMLEKLFNYDRKIVLFTLEQMFDYDLVNLKPGITHGNRNDNIRISLTIKSGFVYGPMNNTILNKKFNFDNEGNLIINFTDTIFTQIAYLNMCAMRVLVNKELVKGDIPICKAQKILDHDAESLFNWVKWKIINSVLLTRLILSADSIEYKKINMSTLTSDQKEIFKLFPRIDHDSFRNTVLNQINHIFTSLEQHQQNEMTSYFLQYKKRWL